jgi:hypothetical protein
VEYWLSARSVETPPVLPDSKPELKWPEIPPLKDYRTAPVEFFWENFPKKDLPLAPSTTINKPALRKMLESSRAKLTTHQYRRGLKVLKDLQEGADAAQKTELPPITVKNASSAFENGRLLTDKIASWVDTGYVAGPFKTAPVPGFRANPLMAVVRKGAVRPIINLSAPKGASFNENVNTNSLEKVRMATAQSFGYAVRKCGTNAKMSKFDKKDAYKLIPAKKKDWNKQGFSWLGRYFLELQQIFGGIPSVSNFDRLGNTVLSIALTDCKIPRSLVFRTLDDVPVVAPHSTDWCETFSKRYKEVCRAANIKIAMDCPAREKAFTNQLEGIVLGIHFNTKKMEWSLPRSKADDLIRKILWAVNADHMSLKQTQQLLGSLNDLSQMCPFIKPFRALTNSFLGKFNANEQVLLSMCHQAKNDLMVCARVAETARTGIPIPSQPQHPTLATLTCFSDAAGCKFTMIQGKRICSNQENDRGVASIVLDKYENVQAWSRLIWPRYFLEEAKDEKGAYFGSKTTTLEAIGLLIPFITMPKALEGKHVTFRVDNISVVFGWDSKIVKNDMSATIIIRAIHLMAAYLGVWVHVQHEPRCSSSYSSLADHLSRKSSTGKDDLHLLANVAETKVEGVLHRWLREPREDWSLPTALLAELRNKH